MVAGITTTIRMPGEVWDLYETLAKSTGRRKNKIIVEALRVEGERRVRELAVILEGRDQARAGRVSPLSDVVARFQAQGMLPPEFDLEGGRVEGSDETDNTAAR